MFKVFVKKQKQTGQKLYAPDLLIHYQTTNFELFQTDRVCRRQFQNRRKLSKQVENTVGKGEIARYEQFLLFPQIFQKACFPWVSKGVIVWEWVNTCKLVHYAQAETFLYL